MNAKKAKTLRAAIRRMYPGKSLRDGEYYLARSLNVRRVATGKTSANGQPETRSFSYTGMLRLRTGTAKAAYRALKKSWASL